MRSHKERRHQPKNNSIMVIKKENIVNAYQSGDESVKAMLRTMFPDIEFETAQAAKKRSVTERIKTFEDACRELGEKHPFVKAWNSIYQGCEDWSKDGDIADVIAYHKLRIVTAALNEGWQPKFTDDEWRWYPWFYLYSEEKLAKKDDKWKQSRTVIATGDYDTEYAGFAFACSDDAPSGTGANVGSRLCYKSEALAEYSGRQFADLWADFNLIRK